MHLPRELASDGASGCLGLLGATSFVGRAILGRWLGQDPSPSARSIVAFTRSQDAPPDAARGPGIAWRSLSRAVADDGATIPTWVTVCPVWAVPDAFPRLEAAGARRLVLVSSTSRFTRQHAQTPPDRALAARIAAAEDTVLEWADRRGVMTTILRPTMIYDGVHDRNVARIAACIRRLGFFPVAGRAAGLRQPVHVDDVASACLAAAAIPPSGAGGRVEPGGPEGLRTAYELSGGEVLSFREMVHRIFGWLGRRPWILGVPLPLVRAAVPLVSLVPAIGSVAAMAIRMNQDMVFDHAAAARDLGFSPRPFSLSPIGDPDHDADRSGAPAAKVPFP